MSFDPTWLDLREPADHAARSQKLLRAFCEMMPREARILDLGSGTGSTMRAVSPFLSDASWTLTDHDPKLLALAKAKAPEVETVQVDLAADLVDVLKRDADAITASALIDLVSAEWLDTLTAHAAGRVIYIALSYDGHEEWMPPLEDDDMIFEAFQAHQRGDKGFGPSLGSDAVAFLSEALTEAGYQVQTAASPWQLQSGALMAALSQGIADAVIDAGVESAKVAKWLLEREQSTQCRVGHIDLLAHR